MKHSKTFLITLILITFFISACKKDDPIKINPRDNFIGFYTGEDTNSWGGWSIASFCISESTNGDSFVSIQGLTRYSDQKLLAKINTNNINFSEQSFHVVGTSPGGAHWDYMSVWVGSGILDTSINKIRFEYTEKQIFADTTFVCDWITVGQKQ